MIQKPVVLADISHLCGCLDHLDISISTETHDVACQNTYDVGLN